MRSIKDYHLPKELEDDLRSAKKIEWITVIYLISVVVVMYLVMGSSQAMKSAWLEDVLGLVPSVAFLISTHINSKAPNDRFRYGYHRVFSISFLIGAAALLGMGIFMIYDSSMSLIKTEHPTIGNRIIFGERIWMGWVMIVALIYSSVPSMILGFKKLPKAKTLHNKVLYTDAKAQKADYMTAFAAIVGIIGVGGGWWWADSVAALFISISVLKDGINYVSTAVTDLMDRSPVTLKEEKEVPLINEIKDLVLSWDWVKDANVRFREDGQVFMGEIAVVPKTTVDTEKLEEAYEKIYDYSWKISDVVIGPVKKLPKW
ncbi:cation diffusion facilitator family transporter [Zunongwangia sp. F363]|uniref:Cation diffusion facilitator family transporter n=1 Tax=Autumnicola tepida TaxID=3075595 RepID=A0ABU3CCK5_9FLAO|nr:cation diffusion facilitator family transporter [Zunongwangia sp. F363]MDT0644072.1 cation diffusion facilitator family transporter [Zunongwangia sp. F363]